MRFLRQVVEHQAPLIGHYACGVASFSSHLKSLISSYTLLSFSHPHWCTDSPWSTHVYAVKCIVMTWKSLNCLPFVPELDVDSCWLFFVVVDQSIAVCFLSLLFFSLMTRILRLRLFQSIAKLPKVTCSSWAPVTWARWWRPGRVETCRLGEVEMSLNSFCLSPLSSAGCSGFADCLLTLPQLLTFPAKDGVELALLREAVDLRLTLYREWSHKLNRHVPIEEGCLQAAPTGGH